MAPNYPYSNNGLPPQTADHEYPDMWTSFAAMAAVTSRIRLICGVYVLPIRNPIEVAKQSATLAILSQGRFCLGMGSGWMKEEFDAYNNADFGVSFSPAQIATKSCHYNYRTGDFAPGEAPGSSVFSRDEQGIYHSYSCYARGLDMLNVAYHYLDLTPRGRDEDTLPFSMAWVDHHDRHE